MGLLLDFAQSREIGGHAGRLRITSVLSLHGHEVGSIFAERSGWYGVADPIRRVLPVHHFLERSADPNPPFRRQNGASMAGLGRHD